MTTLANVAAPARPRLVTRPLLVRFVSVIGTATSFYLLLSAVPLYARSAGAGTGLAGLTTTALTLSSVAAYPVTPRLMARYGSRAVLAGGLLALGLPALALAASDSVGLILAACVVRGAGFAVLCVAGGALTVSLIPARRRGAGLALVGLVSGIPAVAALPLGVWLAGHLGYRPVFAAGGLAALAGIASLPWLPNTRSITTRADGMLAALRNPALVRPAFSVEQPGHRHHRRSRRHPDSSAAATCRSRCRSRSDSPRCNAVGPPRAFASASRTRLACDRRPWAWARPGSG